MQEKVNASAAFPAGYFGGTDCVGGNLGACKAANKYLPMKFGRIVGKSWVLADWTHYGGSGANGKKKAALLGERLAEEFFYAAVLQEAARAMM